MGVLGAKQGKSWCDIDPQWTRSYFSGFFRLCQCWWKSIKKCDRESARRRTDTLTDANRFYNLSHAICYSYGTDKNTHDNIWLQQHKWTHSEYQSTGGNCHCVLNYNDLRVHNGHCNIHLATSRGLCCLLLTFSWSIPFTTITVYIYYCVRQETWKR